MKSWFRLIICVLAVATLTAETASRTVDWESVRRRGEGRDATVHLRNGEIVRGRVSLSSNALIVDGTSIRCSDIAELEIRTKSRRALWAAIGGAAGLAAGALLSTRFSNEGNDGAAAGLAGGLAAAGAGIGYAAGGGGKTRVFILSPDSCPL